MFPELITRKSSGNANLSALVKPQTSSANGAKRPAHACTIDEDPGTFPPRHVVLELFSVGMASSGAEASCGALFEKSASDTPAHLVSSSQTLISYLQTGRRSRIVKNTEPLPVLGAGGGANGI